MFEIDEISRFNSTTGMNKCVFQKNLVGLGWVVFRNLHRFNNFSVILRLGSRRYLISEIEEARPGFEDPLLHKRRA